MGVCVRVYLNKTSNSTLPFHPLHSQYSFHPLHSQYRRHHLDHNKHRSVCGVGGGDELWMCVWVAQCRLCKVTPRVRPKLSAQTLLYIMW